MPLVVIVISRNTVPPSSVPISPHLFLECLIPKMKALWSTETSATIHKLTRYNIFSNKTARTSNVTKYTYSYTQCAVVNTQSTLMMEPPQKWVVVRTPWNSTNIKCIHRVVPKTNTGCVCVLGFGYIILWQMNRKQCRKERWTAEHTNNQTNITMHKFQCEGKKLRVKIQHVGKNGYKAV